MKQRWLVGLCDIPILGWMFVGLLLYFPLFHQLGTPVIRLFDESRLVKNATEMLASGNLLVVTFDGKPDLWSTKPPLLIWFQALFIAIFGRHDWVVRLPSVLSALATCWAVSCAIKAHFTNIWWRVLGVLVLVTMPGFLFFHAVRYAEYDALLTCCTTWAGVTWWRYVSGEGRKYLFRAVGWLIAGVLAKSVAALLFLPTMFVALLLHFRVRKTDAIWWFAVVFVFVLIVGGYYAAREWANSGYLAAVLVNDIGGRFGTALDGHTAEFSYYFWQLWHSEMGVWAWVLVLFFPLGFFFSTTRQRLFLLYVVGMMVSFGLIISAAQTKLAWYNLPLFPWLAICVVVGLQAILRLSTKAAWVGISGIFLCVAFAYIPVVQRVSTPKELPEDAVFYDLAYFLKGCQVGKFDPNGLRIIYPTYRPNIDWYVETLQKNSTDIKYIGFHEVQIGMKVVTARPQERDIIADRFQTKTLYQNGLVSVVLIVD